MTPTATIGLIGLGTMGAALALNIAEKGFAIAVFNRTTATTRAFVAGAGDLALQLTACDTLADLVAAIRKPRSIIIMVNAGDPVDEQIAALRPLLGKDDVIIDAGNANFQDTNRRAADAAAAGCRTSVSGCQAGRKARGMARRSWRAGQRRRGTGLPR